MWAMPIRGGYYLCSSSGSFWEGNCALSGGKGYPGVSGSRKGYPGYPGGIQEGINNAYPKTIRSFLPTKVLIHTFRWPSPAGVLPVHLQGARVGSLRLLPVLGQLRIVILHIVAPLLTLPLLIHGPLCVAARTWLVVQWRESLVAGDLALPGMSAAKGATALRDLDTSFTAHACSRAVMDGGFLALTGTNGLWHGDESSAEDGWVRYVIGGQQRGYVRV